MTHDPLLVLVRAEVERQGFELVEFRRTGTAARPVLKVRADRPDSRPGAGITTQECAALSRAIERLLEAGGHVGTQYVLEVSSPGIERPLRTARHFAPYTGEKVFIEMVHVVDERRRFKGRLVAAGPESVEVEVDGRRHVLPLNGIRKAHLAPDL